MNPMDPSLTGLGDVVIGCLLAALGVASIALSLFRRQGTNTLLASFGAFVALYGIRLILNNPLAPALGFSRFTGVWISQIVTYSILVPAWYFFWRLLGDGWHRLNFWWVRVVAIFAVVAIGTDVLQAEPGSLGPVNNLMVLLGLLIIIFGLWGRRGRMTTDLRILATGLSVFGLSAINENLVPLGLVPWSWRGETWGFLFFVACLGWIAARRFVSTERNLASVEGELEAAKRIQTSILPSTPPSIAGLDLAFRFQPSSAVAGDFFDFLTPDPKQLAVVVADVSGHGVPAALIASMVKVAFESRVDSADRPARLLTLVNQTLCGSFRHGFVTAAFLFLDLQHGEGILSSAGHPLPLLRRRSEEGLREIGGGGAILGRFPQATFEQQHLALAVGDRLVLYTDGITEARDPAGELYGEERLQTAIRQGDSLSAEELCREIMAELGRWVGDPADPNPEDDITLVVVDIVTRSSSAD